MSRFGLSERFRVAAVKARRARRAAASRLLGSRLLRWRYGPAAPRALLIAPQDMRARDESFWPEVQSGFLGLAGSVADFGDGSPFDAVPPGQAWLRAFHGFSWLRHLEAAVDEEADIWARDCVLHWIDRQQSHPPVAFAPEVRARRIISWLSGASILLDTAEPDIVDAITRGLAAEVLALSAGWRTSETGAGRLTSLTALVLARLAFEDDESQLDAVIALLLAEIDRQVLSDGGHISRNPAALIDVLLDWLPLKTCFEVRNIRLPARLSAGIDRALGMLRYLRLGDGGIARFNGMGIADPGALATLMAYDDRPTPDWPIAPASRYSRLASGSTVVIVDVGSPPPLDDAGAACAGVLSFEVSSGTSLLFVNVGAPGSPDADWRTLSRATASHTTACLGEVSSAQLVRAHGLGDMIEAPPLALAGTVRADVRSDGMGQRLEASHEGYAGRCGFIHRRNILLAEGGGRIEGADQFEPVRRVAGAGEVSFALHFHLHPSVTATVLAEGMTSRTVRLMLVVGDGSHWLFEAEGARATVEESTFLASSSGPRPSLQIVLRGLSIGGSEITWSMTRQDDTPAEAAETEIENPRT